MLLWKKAYLAWNLAWGRNIEKKTNKDFMFLDFKVLESHNDDDLTMFCSLYNNVGIYVFLSYSSLFLNEKALKKILHYIS